VTARSRWLVVSAVLAVAVVILVWRGCRWDGARSDSDEHSVDGITLTSPDLDLQLLAMRTTDRPGFTDWSCLLECRERSGCRADVRVKVLYRTAGERRTLSMGGRIDVANGESARIGRVQRPPTEIDRIDEVVVEVAAPYTPGGPRPTPVQ
jgi:hypothetical protein